MSYLTRTPFVPLLCTLFNRAGDLTEEFLDYQGRTGVISIVWWNLRPVIFGVEYLTSLFSLFGSLRAIEAPAPIAGTTLGGVTAALLPQGGASTSGAVAAGGVAAPAGAAVASSPSSPPIVQRQCQKSAFLGPCKLKCRVTTIRHGNITYPKKNIFELFSDCRFTILIFRINFRKLPDTYCMCV